MTVRHALAALALLGLATPLGAAEAERPTMIGLDGPDLDACGGIGSVTRLDPDGDNFLAVRERPDRYAREKDRLGPHTLVWLCEGQDDWQGIVYPSGKYQDLSDCQVGGPVPKPRPYDGPCKHGWVSSHYIELVAG